MSDPIRVLASLRDGRAPAPGDVRAFVEALVAGRIGEAHAGAFLMGVCARGLETDAVVELTRAMLASGATLEFDSDGGPLVDKHSTGGIGDKASLPLAPALAACGARVPMVSGRGLGHTGGTLDKLEAIPGFDVHLDADGYRRCLAGAGFAIGAQTAELVPADKQLYALRDATGLVASIPLIASSILSKKLAEGIGALVLDVKFGSGAFLPDPAAGRALAETMVRTATAAGVRTVARMTAMDRPLGRAVGHAIEVREAWDCLQGAGPDDLRELVEVLGAELLVAGELAADLAEGRARIGATLDDGRAAQCFLRGVEQQGGDPGALERGLSLAQDLDEWLAPGDGHFICTDAREVGGAVVELGGGRSVDNTGLDLGVGLELLEPIGTRVSSGQPLARLVHRGGRGLEAARARLAAGLGVDPDGEPPAPLIGARIAAYEGSGTPQDAGG
ncbi:MAG: thymidine phosphorylase [Planctomycetota bacterium]